MNHNLLQRQHIPGYLEQYVSHLVAAVSLDTRHPTKLRHLCQNALVLYEKSSRYGIAQDHGKPEQTAISRLQRAEKELKEARGEIHHLLAPKSQTELDLDPEDVAKSIELLGEADRQLTQLCSALEVFFDELLFLNDECECDIQEAMAKSKLHLAAGDRMEIPDHLIPRHARKKNEHSSEEEPDSQSDSASGEVESEEPGGEPDGE